MQHGGGLLKTNVHCACGRPVEPELLQAGMMSCRQCDIGASRTSDPEALRKLYFVQSLLQRATIEWWMQYDAGFMPLPEEIPLEELAELQRCLCALTGLDGQDNRPAVFVELISLKETGPSLDVKIGDDSFFTLSLDLDVGMRKAERWLRNRVGAFEPSGAVGINVDHEQRVLRLLGRRGKRAIRIPDYIELDKVLAVLEASRVSTSPTSDPDGTGNGGGGGRAPSDGAL